MEPLQWVASVQSRVVGRESDLPTICGFLFYILQESGFGKGPFDPGRWGGTLEDLMKSLG